MSVCAPCWSLTRGLALPDNRLLSSKCSTLPHRLRTGNQGQQRTMTCIGSSASLCVPLSRRTIFYINNNILNQGNILGFLVVMLSDPVDVFSTAFDVMRNPEVLFMRGSVASFIGSATRLNSASSLGESKH